MTFGEDLYEIGKQWVLMVCHDFLSLYDHGFRWSCLAPAKWDIHACLTKTFDMEFFTSDPFCEHETFDLIACLRATSKIIK